MRNLCSATRGSRAAAQLLVAASSTVFAPLLTVAREFTVEGAANVALLERVMPEVALLDATGQTLLLVVDEELILDVPQATCDSKRP